MLSGGWGIGLVLSTDTHLYGINSVLGLQASKSRLKMISRAVVLKAHMYWDFCRPLKIQDFYFFSYPLWRRQWHPIPVFLPGESQGRRSLAGCQSMGSHRAGHD